MNNLFSEKLIYFEIRDSGNSTADIIGNGNNVMVIEDFASITEISCDGLPSLNSAVIRIYGLANDIMNKLSFIKYKGRNEVSNYTINCYYRNNNSLIFSGDIINSYPDYSKVPDVSFYISAITNYRQIVNPTKPTSIKGEQNITNIVNTIAKDMNVNYTVINNGVNISDANIYLEGSNIQKLIKLSQDYDFDIIINNNSIVITDYDNVINNKNDVVILDCAKGDNVIGYIQLTQDGVQLEIYFEPRIQLGCQIRIVNSYNTIANGDYKVTRLQHILYSKIEGSFKTLIKANYYHV